MRKCLLAFLMFICSFCSIKALEICTPSDEYIEYSKLSEEEKANYIEPIYCKELIDKEDNSINSKLKSQTKSIFNIFLSTYPSSYNAMDHNLVTSIKHQYTLGTCWAFSAIAAVETNALKNGLSSYDFSEQHLIQSLVSSAYSDDTGKVGKYSASLEGGKITYSPSYYFNGYGQLLESELPYDKTGAQITSADYIPGRKMISVSQYELNNVNSFGVCETSEIDNIKEKIMNYGAVQGSMYMDDALFKDSGKNYYLSTSTNSPYPNHGITIIGWDDSISKNNFNGATRDGAWIIKNSWGTTWSSDGLFYISYDDHFICKNNATFSGVSTKTFDNTYKAADMVGVPGVILSNTVYMSSKFTKQSEAIEELNRISVSTGDNMTYKVYLSKSNNIHNKADWILLSTGTSDTYAIRSADLSETQTIDSDFTIIVEYVIESGQTSAVFTMCNNSSDTSTMEFTSKTNYITVDGTMWYDMSNLNIDGVTTSCEPNIFAYTNNISNVNELDIDVDSINNDGDTTEFQLDTNLSLDNLTYTITDSTNQNITSKFVIIKNDVTKLLTLISNNKISGSFKLIVTYQGSQKTINFTLEEAISAKDNSNVVMGTDDLLLSIENNPVTIENFINKFNTTNTEISVTDKNGTVITNTGKLVATNNKLKTNSDSYNIEVLGDVNCDGKISALDYIEIRKHIMGTEITDAGKMIAADINRRSGITALDYIEIRKILMR